MDSHSHKYVHDKTHSKRIWIVIRTEMRMKKTHMNMDIHSYRNVHDKNPYTKKWIFIRTEMCMTKTHTQRNG